MPLRSLTWLLGALGALGALFAALVLAAEGRSQAVAVTAQVEGLRVQGTSPVVLDTVIASGDVTATGSGDPGDGIGVVTSIDCSGYQRVSVSGTVSNSGAECVVWCFKYARNGSGAWKGEMAEKKTLTVLGSAYTEDSQYFTSTAHFDTVGYGLVKVVLESVSAGDADLRARVN